uniref:C2H2-type domain-containing protein n=1 Tax=Physcomitrium patens TaxID=3218 RepID=A0A2K1IHR4_PHYPA|nr:hypothetical protein PHYPA_027500 [Physcomitrium patens]
MEEAPEDDTASTRKRGPPDYGYVSDEDGVTSKPQFECKYCHKQFSVPQALGGHMNTHRLERKEDEYEQAQLLLNAHAHRHEMRLRSAGWQIVDPTTAVRSSNTVLMTLPRLDAPRPLIPPQFSYNEAWQPISPTMRPMIPQPSPPHYHLASTTSRSNLHHLRWRAPGYNPNANVPGFVPLDPSLQRGGMQPEFRQGVLQPGQCGGSSAGPSLPLQIQCSQRPAASPTSRDDSTHMQSRATLNLIPPSVSSIRRRARLVRTRSDALVIDPQSVGRSSEGSFQPSQSAGAHPMEIGGASTSQPRDMGQPSSLPSHSFHDPSGPSSSSLPPSHEDDPADVRQHRLGKAPMTQRSLGSSASASESVRAGNQVVYHLNVQSDDASNQLPMNQDVGATQSSKGTGMQSATVPPKATVIDDAIEGSESESITITTVESGEVSGPSTSTNHQAAESSRRSP